MTENKIEDVAKKEGLLYHGIAPVYDAASKILVLGSFPSVKSREGGFFYHHPQNRFWKTLSGVLQCALPETIEEKKHMLLMHHIALWDVAAACTVSGSSDGTISNVAPNDIGRILNAAPIAQIFANGGTAYALYRRLCQAHCGMEAAKLPSTSPANAAFSLPRLIQCWSVILENLS